MSMSKRLAVHAALSTHNGQYHGNYTSFFHPDKSGSHGGHHQQGLQTNMRSSFHGNGNVLLGGAMLSVVITVVCFVCYCCHRTIKKRTTTMTSYRHRWVDTDPNMEIYSVEQCYETSGLFMDSDSSMMGAPLPPPNQGPPPSYDSVVANDELYARSLAYRKYSQHELDETDELMDDEQRNRRALRPPLSSSSSGHPHHPAHYCPYMYVNPHQHHPPYLPNPPHHHPTTTAVQQEAPPSPSHPQNNQTSQAHSHHLPPRIITEEDSDNRGAAASPISPNHHQHADYEADGGGGGCGDCDVQLAGGGLTHPGDNIHIVDEGNSATGRCCRNPPHLGIGSPMEDLSGPLAQSKATAAAANQSNSATIDSPANPSDHPAPHTNNSPSAEQILSPKQMVLLGRQARQQRPQQRPREEARGGAAAASCDCQSDEPTTHQPHSIMMLAGGLCRRPESMLPSHLCQCQQMAQMACSEALCQCTNELFREDRTNWPRAGFGGSTTSYSTTASSSARRTTTAVAGRGAINSHHRGEGRRGFEHSAGSNDVVNCNWRHLMAEDNNNNNNGLNNLHAAINDDDNEGNNNGHYFSADSNLGFDDHAGESLRNDDEPDQVRGGGGGKGIAEGIARAAAVEHPRATEDDDTANNNNPNDDDGNNSITRTSSANRCGTFATSSPSAAAALSTSHSHSPDDLTTRDANNNGEAEFNSLPPRPPIRTTSRYPASSAELDNNSRRTPDHESASDLNNNNSNERRLTANETLGMHSMDAAAAAAGEGDGPEERYCDPLLYENGVIRMDMSKIIDQTGLPTYEAALRLESSGYV